jgi:predicted Zn-dependent protease
MLSVARHEVGHAIRLWGHSPNPEGGMYFPQSAVNFIARFCELHRVVWSADGWVGRQ